jgi:ABC-type uncharacterized transport system substrate-binding protein
VKRILVLAAIALAGFILRPPLAAAAPPGHTVRVGVLGMFAPSFDPTTDPLIREFIDGLRELGYTPGRDIVFEYKSAQGNVEALPQVAKELVQSRVDILLTPNTSMTLAGFLRRKVARPAKEEQPCISITSASTRMIWKPRCSFTAVYWACG